jgi:aminoglycoside phosphotransferase (APT) family kinase protein
MADELAILHQKLPLILEYYPSWEKRIKELLEKCDRLAEKTLPPSQLSGIHRDFYFDQIIVNHDHLYLLDLDLYCQGDPSLDIGNFIGHLTEYAIRKYGNFQALKHHENALEAEFLKLSGSENRYNIKAYTILTLVRHIYLSTQFGDRLFTTEILFDLCQKALRI